MKSKNKAAIIWIVVILIVLIGLFLYPKLTTPRNKSQSDSKVPCLVPNLPLLQHIHPQIKILVDGEEEILPSNIGMGACEKAIHTHDEDAAAGVIHVESQDAREYTLGDFFGIWEKPLNRDGYLLEVKVDGTAVQNPAEIIFKDGQQIIFNYKKL